MLFWLGLIYTAGGVLEAVAPVWFEPFMMDRVGEGFLRKLGASPSPGAVEYWKLSPPTRRWLAIWTRIIPGICWTLAAWPHD